MTMQPLDVFACPLSGSTLIEASAGTGKTWAITGLVLRLIIERGLPVQEILVVTFTKAATAELRERIRERLQEVLLALDFPSKPNRDPFIRGLLDHALPEIDTDTIQRRLAAALAAFDEAAIYTIHGYCQRALGDAPLTAGQPFELALVDDQSLCREVSTDFWRKYIATVDDPLLATYLARTLSPTMLENQLRRRLNKPLARYRWPADLDLGSDSPPSPEPLEALFAETQTHWNQDGEGALQMLLAAAEDKLIHGATYKAASIRESAEAWGNWLSAESPPDSLPPNICRRWCADELEKKKNKNKTAPSHPLFTLLESLWAALLARENALHLARLHYLRTFLDSAPAEVQQQKRTRRQASFDDLLGNLHQALTRDGGEALAQNLAQRYPAALIDEFQDTDPLQFDIFRRIYTEPTESGCALFLVGDPKQAIYSFRQADLPTYLQARNAADRCFYLPDNQRSSVELISAVNALFSQHAQPFMLPGLDFQPVGVGQKPRSIFQDNRTGTNSSISPLHCWQLPSTDPLDKSAAQRLAATACAQEMADLLAGATEGMVTITQADGTRRSLLAGDLAILVRTNEQGRQMKAALAKVGLAAAELSTGSVFASQEAADLELLLLALAEPGRLDRIRTVLSTVWLGLDATEIAALASNTGHEQVHGQSHDLSAWLLRFQQGQQRWLRQGLAVTVHRLLAEWEISSRLLGLPDGERKLTNILHLIELLHEHEQSGGKVDPSALLRWLGQQRAEPYAAGEAAQLRLESDEKLVRIVTIHRSKGLEYPVVFCPFIWEGPGKTRDGQEGEEYPAATEGATRCIDFRGDDEPDIQAGKMQIQLEEAAENLRLIYVALTRAVHRCYLIVGPYQFQRSTKDSQRALLNWLVAGHNNPAGWVEDGGDWAAIQHAWEKLSTTIAAISLVALPDYLPAANPIHPVQHTQTNKPSTLNPPSFRPPLAQPNPLPISWRLDSFTGLLRGAHLTTSQPETQQAIQRESGVDRDSAVNTGNLGFNPAEDDILEFERGARAGECIHSVFEHADFTHPASWPSAITQALQTHPPLKGNTDLSAVRLQHMLADVLNTPLPTNELADTFTLATIPPANRLCELEFSLPVSQLSAESLWEICQRHHLPIPRLSFHTLEGYLRGFIDLVFRVRHPSKDDCYYLLDWKSNYLGDTPADYGQENLQDAMIEHGYFLQALIYCLALHRHLRVSHPNYDPARHLGGAYYLFVRGVRPDWLGAGVMFWRPSLELLTELEVWITGGRNVE
ncbi:MAG: exodeoxyribonuclease beta chain RecB [Pseudomonadota bacterium]